MSVRLSVLLVSSAFLTACMSTASGDKGIVQNAINSQPLVSMEQWAERCEQWDRWDKPAPPFRIHANTYYVGTCGIAAILVTGPQGNVLIDSGTQRGVETVLTNLRRLGLDAQKIDFLLNSHEHFDHIGGHARMQQASGAQVLATPIAASVMQSGKTHSADPQFASEHPPIAKLPTALPIEVDSSITLAGMTFKPISTPGHTPGAVTWQWKSCDEDRCKTIVYADSLSPVSSDNYRFSDHPEYLAQFRASLSRVAALECDILITPHPSSSDMVQRLAGGSLDEGMNCRAFADTTKQRLDDRLNQEAEASQ